MNPNKVTFSKGRKNDVRKTLLIFLCHCVFIMLFLPYCASASCAQVDRDALLSLDFKASSPLNWSASLDCCLWEGIICGPDDRVLHLWLPGRALSGSVSPAITNLTYLTHLNLSHNSLSSQLPDGLFSSLSSLQVLDLSFNRLHGPLPNSSLEASKLQIVDLSSNSFIGTIPSVASDSLSFLNVSKNSFAGSIPISVFCKNGSNHNNLTILDLSFNRFTGPIPTGLASCSKLQVFRASFNALSGSLPDDIFGLADLQQLSLHFNRLSGPIGGGIAGLTNLKILELYSNQFVGDIPSQIGSLVRLEKLVLHSNNLTGALPPSLNNCTNLSTLNLGFNNLTGDLSTFNLSTFQLLTTLDLGNNNFTGKLPKSLYSCKSLTAIRLDSNNLQGQISPEILALESLSFLSISNNNFTNATGAFMVLMGCKNLTTLVLTKSFMLEPLPNDQSLAGLDGFDKLQILAMGGCKFTGEVPTWIAKLKNLQVLDLSYNLMTGSVPGWLGSLPKLFYMDLSNNLFAGGFPEELCGMPSLTSKEVDDKVEQRFLELPFFVMSKNGTTQQYSQFSQLPLALYLGWNSLSGNIPIEIGQLKFLQLLDLSHNNFSGSIPDQMSNISNLEKLDLSYNHLSGAIPASLNALNFLSFFSVAYNDLQGSVPSGGQFNTFASSSFEGNPRLCGFQTAQPSCHHLLSPANPPVFAGTQRSSDMTLSALIFGITFGIFLV